MTELFKSHTRNQRKLCLLKTLFIRMYMQHVHTAKPTQKNYELFAVIIGIVFVAVVGVSASWSNLKRIFSHSQISIWLLMILQKKNFFVVSMKTMTL